MNYTEILFVVIALITLIVGIACVLYIRYCGHTVNKVITGGARKKSNSNLRIKDLQKHPRSRSEAEVVRYLEEITGEKFPTAYPKWLIWRGSNLELDGYNQDLGVALEFSGPLHTKWYPQMESYADYFDRVTKDIVKKRLCKRHNVHLMVIDASLPARHWRDYVKSRLYDYKLISTEPLPYINEQIAKPFRNEQLESELGLEGEFAAANKL